MAEATDCVQRAQPPASTSAPSLVEIQNLAPGDPRQAYKRLKRVTLPHLQSSTPSYRRCYVAVCLEGAEEATDGEIVVGLLLLAAMGVASMLVWEEAGGLEFIQRLYRSLGSARELRRCDFRANGGVYAMTMVKYLNKIALGLLSGSTGAGDGARLDVDNACLDVVECMHVVGRDAGGEVWLRVAKGVAAMAPHGLQMGRWMDAVSRAVVGFRDANMGLSDMADVVEEGVSCVRRMMTKCISSLAVTESVVARVLHSVAWLYGVESPRDARAGLLAVGAVAKSMSASRPASKRVMEEFGTAIGCLRTVDNIDVKEMVWLAGVLYAKGRESRVLGWLIEWSLQCSLAGLRLAVRGHGNDPDEAMVTRCCSDVAQCILILLDGSVGEDGKSDALTCSLLVDVAMQLRSCGRSEDVSSLIARVVRRIYKRDTTSKSSMTVRGVLDVVMGSVKDVELWVDLTKDGIAALASAMREVQRAVPEVVGAGHAGQELNCLVERIREDVAQVLAFVHNAFNPSKTPGPYVEMVVAFHAHMDVFSNIVSTDSLLTSIGNVLESTKTKIGKKRIEDVVAVLEMLRVEAAINDLLKQSQAHSEGVTRKRKDELRNNPALIHSDEWIASDSLQETVAFMLDSGDRWQEVVNAAKNALNAAERSTKALGVSAAQNTEHELVAFIRVHDSSVLFTSLLAPDSFDRIPHDINDPMRISMQHASLGNLHAALQIAMEGHRRAELQRKAPSGPAGTCTDWWSALSSHIAHSAWLGFLFSVCGMYNESRRAYSDGLRTSCQVGAVHLAAFLSASLAELHLVGGDMARFQMHTSNAAKILAHIDRDCNNDGPAARAACAVRLLTAHVEVLRAAVDRHKLEFDSAASRISDVCSKHRLSYVDQVGEEYTCWYGARIAALAAWQEALLELDQHSTMTAEHLERRLSSNILENLNPMLLGAPFAMMNVLFAQALCATFFDRGIVGSSAKVARKYPGSSDDQFKMWAMENNASDTDDSDHTENALLARKLGRLVVILRTSPFCQRTVLLLLAPIMASLGCKYASIALLHASSNPTLEFQQTLVTCTKGAKVPVDVPLSCPAYSSSCAPLIEALVANADMNRVEACATTIVREWTSKLPGLVICGIAVFSSATFGPVRDRRDSLVIYRLKDLQVPLIIEVPSPEVQPSHPIHALHGTKACGAIQFLTERLCDILKRSNANMRSVSADSSDAEQRAWWQERVELDHSMQQLLQELQTDWIGPWRCLFLNDSRDLDGGQGEGEGEGALLRRLLASARLSAMEIKSLSALLSSLDINADSLADEFQERLHIRESYRCGIRSRNDSKVKRHVSFAAAGEVSPEPCGMVRGGCTENEIEGGGGDLVARIADTPGISLHESPSNTHVTVRRKHKSRLAHLQSMATPNPRRALGARNFAGPSYQTPMPVKSHSNMLEKSSKTMPALLRKGATRDLKDDDGANRSRNSATILVLDHAIQSLPWESSFLMVNQMDGDHVMEFYRLPSLPTLLSTPTSPETRPTPVVTPAAKSINSTYYTINPSGDLVSTQETFESWFKDIRGWSGVSGRAPTAEELGTALQNHDLFIYCGHGGGEQYLPVSRLRALDTCASSILMGCSSGKLAAGGVYDATGIALSYLMAGSHAVVGNLWDVTDKDIDRYCLALLHAMMESPRGEANLGAMVQQCRLKCRLMYLIGASPVVYGVPVRFA